MNELPIAAPSHDNIYHWSLPHQIDFGVPSLRPWPADTAYELALDDFDGIAVVNAACVPLVQQTEIYGAEGSGLRAVIECPIKVYMGPMLGHALRHTHDALRHTHTRARVRLML